MSSKTQLRREMHSRLASLQPGYIAESDAGMEARLSVLPEFLAARTVFAYHSMEREAGTQSLITLALSLGKRVALPVTLGGGIMEFAAFSGDGSELESGAFGILQPKREAERLCPGADDIVIVPALSFDLSGYRLGHGGGYYDRYLAGCEAFTVGLCREKMLLPQVPREAHDIPVCCLVTENKTARPKKGPAGDN